MGGGHDIVYEPKIRLCVSMSRCIPAQNILSAPVQFGRVVGVGLTKDTNPCKPCGSPNYPSC